MLYNLSRTFWLVSNYDPDPTPLHVWAGVAFVFLLAMGLYMLPTIIALSTGHPLFLGIAFLNVLLGWTVIGWVAVFIWACIKPSPRVTVMQPFQPPVPARPRIEDELEALQRLRERKLLTEEEFTQKRHRLLDSI